MSAEARVARVTASILASASDEAYRLHNGSCMPDGYFTILETGEEIRWFIETDSMEHSRWKEGFLDGQTLMCSQCNAVWYMSKGCWTRFK